jgi:hypothetical protein
LPRGNAKKGEQIRERKCFLVYTALQARHGAAQGQW